MDLKISEAWLREKISLDMSQAQLARQLTQIGLAVESLTPVAPPFNGVVIVKVVEVRPHPSADSLSICKVDDGKNKHTVVCGAVNVRVGIYAALATVGAQLPDNLIITARKIRGQLSSGMLCSAVELGLSADNNGILVLSEDAESGVDLRAWLQLDDYSLHLDVTPNRVDCLSVTGLARELAAVNEISVAPVDDQLATIAIDDTMKVTLVDSEACPRYLGRIIRGVNVNAKTPDWMRERLRRSNINPIHPVVDVTNYVLRELGQPLHAFDLNKLTGSVQVRQAVANEQLVLLTQQTLDLQAGSLVIADDSGPIALAGIMGGKKTAINTDAGSPTTDIFLESAYFNPMAIVGRARNYGLVTDAAQCYEHGVDFELQFKAIERATALLLEIVGGQPGPVCEVSNPECLPVRRWINLRPSRIKKLLGIDVDSATVQAMFKRLGFAVQQTDEHDVICQIKPPSHRFDIDHEADLIEEVARLYGYDKIPYEVPHFKASLSSPSKATRISRISPADALSGLGYHEIITYSFVNENDFRQISPDAIPVRLTKPVMADRPVMRASLLPGLLATMTYNFHRQQRHIRLFELGAVFEYAAGADRQLLQQQRIGGLIAGYRWPESWHQPNESADFYDLKGDIEQMFALLSLESPAWIPAKHSALHPGQTAQLSIQGQSIGVAGRLHPRLEAKFDIKNSIYVFEINIENVPTLSSKQLQPVSAFPSVRRDIAIVVSSAVWADQLLECARHAAGPLLNELIVFDLYAGEGIEQGKRSVGLGFIFQDLTRNLQDAEIELMMEQVLKMLHNEFQAVLRM